MQININIFLELMLVFSLLYDRLLIGLFFCFCIFSISDLPLFVLSVFIELKIFCL